MLSEIEQLIQLKDDLTEEFKDVIETEEPEQDYEVESIRIHKEVLSL